MEQSGEEMNLEFHWSRCMTGSFLKEWEWCRITGCKNVNDIKMESCESMIDVKMVGCANVSEYSYSDEYQKKLCI